jgi:hypothetical protein
MSTIQTDFQNVNKGKLIESFMMSEARNVSNQTVLTLHWYPVLIQIAPAMSQIQKLHSRKLCNYSCFHTYVLF